MLDWFLAFCGSGPQWLEQVSLISHKLFMGEQKSLKWTSLFGFTPPLQHPTSCTSGTGAQRGSQGCPGVGRVARRQRQPRGGESWEKRKKTHWDVALDMLASGRCLASSRSLDWRLEAKREVQWSPPTNTSVILHAAIKPSSLMSVPRQLDGTDGLDHHYQELPAPLLTPEVQLQQATFNLAILFPNSSKPARA